MGTSYFFLQFLSLISGIFQCFFQAKVLEPLGAITSGSQFLDPDGNISFLRLWFCFVSRVRKLIFITGQVCSQITFPTLRIRQQ